MPSPEQGYPCERLPLDAYVWCNLCDDALYILHREIA